MKTFLLAVSLCVFLCSTFAQDPDCNNLLIQLARSNPDSWAATLPFLSSPAPTPSNTICRDLVGDESCCDPAFFDALDDAWEVVRQAMREIQEGLNELANMHDEQERALKDQYYAEIDADTTLTSEQRANLKELVERILFISRTFVRNARGRLVPCIEAMLRYTVGFICLSCREVGFLEVLSTTEGRLLLATHVCDDVGGSCAPAILLFIDLMIAIDDFITELCQLVPASTECDSSLGDDPPCTDTATCKDLICTSLLDGFSNGAGFTGFFGDDDAKRSARSQKILQQLGIKKILDGMKKLDSAQQSFKKRQTAPTLTAQYASNGYDASDVGAKSSLDTSAPLSSAAQLSSWLRLLL